MSTIRSALRLPRVRSEADLERSPDSSSLLSQDEMKVVNLQRLRAMSFVTRILG